MSSHAQLRSNILARQWHSGTFLNLGSSITAEIAATVGFDWLLFDFEHGPGSEETLLSQLQGVARTPAAAIVRIAANEPTRFKRALDLGADGVMVPYVNTEAEAKAAVSASRYPPWGTRGVSRFNRAAGFGERFDEVYTYGHQQTVVMAQIETPEGLANAERIAAVDGVDVLFLGPLDLSTNLGIPRNFDHPKLAEARRAVCRAAERSKKAAGILIANADNVATVREEGFTVVALGSDGGAVVAGLKSSVAALKPPTKRGKG